MMNIENLERRREEILTTVTEIRTMKRGTINEQYVKVPRKGREPSLRGPYYVFSRNEGGKTVGFRIKNTENLELLQKDVENYKKFDALLKEYVSVMEEITDITRSDDVVSSKKTRKTSNRI